MHYAEKLDAEAVKLLLARCPNGIREADKEGALPLHWAAEHNAPKEVVELLLKAYPEAVVKRDARGSVAAQLARNASEEVQRLLRGARPPPQKLKAPEPVGLIFPGLPTAPYVGMLKEVQHLPPVKEMLSEAQQLLGFDLLKVCLFGPEDTLQEPVCSQVALYVSSLAAMQKLQTQKCHAGNFQALTGFSVGEYAALTAAGVFSFKDGLALVIERAKASSAHDQASLLVVGLDEPKVLELCLKAQRIAPNEVCDVSCYLHKCSFIVGGTQAAIDAFKSMAKDAKALQLDLLKGWGAFHTKLMQPAMQKFQVKLQDVLCRMSPPRCQVVMNATARPIDRSTDLEEVLRLLGEQLVKPVRWKDSMELMGKLSLEEIYECGPRKQLKALMKRINNDTWWRTGNVEV